MPYIKQERRDQLDYRNHFPHTSGELNYYFTQICLRYLGKDESYQKYNDIVGALENCKLELYRRKIAYYEEKKIIENGDVY